MDAQEIVMTEQVAKAALNSANAELSGALDRMQSLYNKTDIDEMKEDIESFRKDVIDPIRKKLSELEDEKKSLCGAQTSFTWRH